MSNPSSAGASVAPKLSLFRRAASGASWTLIGLGLQNAVRLGSNLFLTRLLAPEAFGVMAVTTMIMTFLNLLSDFGVRPSIIRSEHGTETAFLATARTIHLLRSLGLALLFVIIALALMGAHWFGLFNADSVYADEQLPVFVGWIAAGTAITGLNSVRAVLKERDLSIMPVVRLELFSQLVTVFSIAGCALLGLGAISLVIGTTIGMAAKTFGTYALFDGPSPGFGLEREHMREILGYGKWLVVASTFGFLVQRGGPFVLGYLVNKTEFSLYAIASMWVGTAWTVMQQVVQKVGYPVFSELHRDRPSDRTRVYYRVRQALDAVSVAAFLVTYFISGYILEFLYSDAYQGVGHFVRLSSIGLLLIPYNLLNTVVLSHGDSRRYTVVTVVPGVALAIGVPAIFYWAGFDAAVVFASSIRLFALPMTLIFGRKLVKLNPVREMIPVVFFAVATCMIFLVDTP